ncbi:MAG TPA: galactokinase [Mobilitalea sp.]|nr:galactokinase [Mobilitalea sp.]
MRDSMLSYFKETFGDTEGVSVYFAPGRVNLIGEHTDYNGGHVFPCALTIGTYAAIRIRKDRSLRFYSRNFIEKGVITSSLDELIYHREDDWANYPKGVLWAFAHHSALRAGAKVNKTEVEETKSVDTKQLQTLSVDYGMDVVYWGNIPNSSGLSSSASIEVLTAYMLGDLLKLEISLQDIALLCQYAENKFNGVNCGIMDQFAIAMGKKDHAIYLDTSTLQYEYAPIKLGDAKLVIACSNKRRGLGDSKYNERRSECEEALKRLKAVITINSLGDLSEEEFELHKDIIEDETLIRRARHAVYENRRTVRAVEALKAKDLATFGSLMNDSHYSLRDDYEVTGIELDTLVEAAWKLEGVIGARMTGAGFGGCTVNIVKDAWIDRFIEEVGGAYEEKLKYKADFYVVEIGDGPREI